ncbi:MAG: hypothetical protein Q9187_007826 [Circinaria calcarea]
MSTTIPLPFTLLHNERYTNFSHVIDGSEKGSLPSGQASGRAEAGCVASILHPTSEVLANWSIRTVVNEAAEASPVQPLINMGQGFFGYNPPKFVTDAAKAALDRVDCNQYSPTTGRPRLKKALADAYSPFFGRTINPVTEVTITTGANEGLLSAFMGFIEPDDEVIVFEPFFDQYSTLN